MKIGTKSLLFGVHQFLWHPLTVALAWRKLYGAWPGWAVWISIALHDTGYWGCPNIDGAEGKRHPFRGALWASRLIVLFTRGWWVERPYLMYDEGGLIYHFTACHSRDTAAFMGMEPSKLYAADKACILFDPKWFYILRARLSGELAEFKANAIKNGDLPSTATDGQWFDFYRSLIQSRKGVKELL